MARYRFIRCLAIVGLGLSTPVLAQGGPPVAPMAGGGGGGGASSTVTPDGTGLQALPGSSGNVATFFVANTGTSTYTFSLTCSATGAVTCTNAPASIALDPEETQDIEVTWSYGSGGGAGTIRLATSHDQGYHNVTEYPKPVLTLVVPTETSAGRAVVRNRQPVLRANYRPGGTGLPSLVDSTTLVVTWRGETVTTLVRANRGLVEWEVDSTRRLGVGDSAQFAVTICAASGACQQASRWVVLPADEHPVLGFTGVPLEALGSAFGAPFGPGLALRGAEVETGIGTVPYFSMGAARSTGLVYSTAQSYPRALVPVDLELPWPAGTPSEIRVILRDAGVALDSLVVANPTCATGALKVCRAVLQTDWSGGSYATPTRKWLGVEVRVTSGGTTRSSTDSVEVVVVDRRTTRYGSGWWPSAALALVQAGDDRVLVAPNGAATIFRGSGDSLYLAPPGDTRVLRKVSGGFELAPRGAVGKLVFEAGSAARLMKAVDASGNRDSLSWDGATDKLLAVIDPLGKQITLSYNGSGKLTHFTSLPGGGAARETRVTIDAGTNQLTRDSASSPTAKPYTTSWGYQAYPGTSTMVLARRIGVILDTTLVVYDSTFRRRPVEARLPLVQVSGGAWVKPTIGYRPVERQGYGALRSLDSAYVQTTDPRGYWTRTRLNRWGQGLLTWDSLGALARTRYTPEGLPLWSEGKNGDSSRVYSGYDALGRLTRTWIDRGGSILRTDSLVYDASHRVIQRYDAQGRMSSLVYDAQGRVTHAIAPGITASSRDTTRYWYRSDGLVDSVRSPGSARARQTRYDATWRQVSEVEDEAGWVVAQTKYDQYGRDTTTSSKQRVDVSTGVTQYQWRKVRTYYTIANEADSTVLFRSTSCTGACSNPTWPAASDTTATMRVGYRRDRAGRDSIRLDDRGNPVTYGVDRLGRVRWRQAGSGAADSMAYDVAGNLVRSVTRRGHVITHAYDARGRDTLTVIPGVGNLRRAFGGPLDQLTRLWYDSPVDSIGGVNGELRWTYDARGRLVADTSYTGAVARGRSFTYDAWERPATTTEGAGTWATRYEAHRGIADSLISPFADTLIVGVDQRGRVGTLDLRSSGPQQYLSWDYAAGGELAGFQHFVAEGAGAWYLPLRFELAEVEDSIQAPLTPQWVEVPGSGAASATWRDSVVYDGWERVRSVRQALNGGHYPSYTRTYGFDRAGNVTTPLGQESYAAATGRLQARRSEVDTTVQYGYTYDAAGNLTGRTQVQAGDTTNWAYGWDALDRLVSVRRNDTLIVRYGYDVQGRRIAKRVYDAASGGTVGYTRFVYTGDHVAWEADSAGTPGRRYLWGVGTDHLIGFREADGTRYTAATDKLGSVRALIRQADGVWTGGMRFDPYGTQVDSAGSLLGLRYRWTGREWDGETGFYFHRARYYDPGAKRFISEDPIGYAGGENLYAYVGGAVLEARDPSGLRRNRDVQWCWDPRCYPQSSWDGWFGGMGTLLPKLVTHLYLNGQYLGTISARVSVVQEWLNDLHNSLTPAEGVVGQWAPLPASVVAELDRFFPFFDVTEVRTAIGPTPEGAVAWTLGDRITFKEGYFETTTAGGLALIGHEVLHAYQYSMMTIPGFLALYGAEYLRGRIGGKSHNEAYRSISFEVEARSYQEFIFNELVRVGYPK
ncbi:MAG TPA: RHS repeat-associated core domain-containing protein [Gemmatimonadales bacterium]|nr:RHS repeat-associated core domain-containing protein [Gemmatimonadales bacterium]